MLVLVFLATLPAVTTRIYSSDEVQYFSYLRSLWFDRDLHFEDEYRWFYDRHIAQTPDFYEAFLELKTPTGRRINFGTIGSALLWAPFYGLADAGVRAARAFGSEVAADGFSRPYVAAVAYGSAFYGFLALLLGIRAARLLLGPLSLLPALAVWLGTPLLFYMYVAPPFAHANSAFAVSLFVTIWLHVRGAWSPRGAALLGLSGALMTMVREQDVFFALGPAVDFAVHSWRARDTFSKGRIVTALTGALAFLIGWVPQLASYMVLNGRLGPSQYVTRKMLWHAPFAPHVLFDPNHGLFFWTPLALPALAGLVLLATGAAERPRPPEGGYDKRRDAPAASGFSRTGLRGVAWILLLMLALQVYVSGAVESWTVAGAFGQRRFVAVSVILIVGLSALWRVASHGARATRIGLTALIVLCVWWNLGLIALFGTRMMDRQRVEVRRNAYDVFVTLPARAPELAWRYFTARDTFYEPPRPPADPQ